MKVPLYRHNLMTEDTQALGKQFGQMLSGMMISTGSVSAGVSKQFATYLERKHCILTSSWTTGMMSALIALGVGPGDEVVMPAMTFCATANAVEALGAKAVFVDIDIDTKLMNLELAANAVTDKTKAVIPVHLYGQMVDVKKLKFLLPDHIPIIEDAAHAIEAAFDSERPGTHSLAALFSFYQSKNMTTGEGGAVVTDDDEFFNKISKTYRHGVDLCGYQRHIREEFIAPNVVSLGIKANMPDILAMLLPPQIAKADLNLERRNEIAFRYMEKLEGFVDMPYVVSRAKHAWHMFPIAVAPSKREGVLIDLFNHNINTTVHFRSLPMTDYYSKKYGYKPEDHPIAYQWGESVFSLPVFPGLHYEEQDYVIEAVKLAINRQ